MKSFEISRDFIIIIIILSWAVIWLVKRSIKRKNVKLQTVALNVFKDNEVTSDIVCDFVFSYHEGSSDGLLVVVISQRQTVVCLVGLEQFIY